MKKIFLTSILLILLPFAGARAQSSYDCSVVGSGNYSKCCVLTSGNDSQCDAYCASPAGQTDQSCPGVGAPSGGTTSNTGGASAGNYCNNVPGTNAPACCSDGTNLNSCQSICNIRCPAQNIPGMVSGGSPSSAPSSGGLLDNSTLASATTTNSPALRACSAIKFVSLLDIVIWVKCIIVGALLPLLFALAFLYFLWGVLKFMQAREQKDRSEAKQRVIWGLVGMFVMVSVWGIVKIASDTLGIQNTVPLLQTDYLSTENAHH